MFLDELDELRVLLLLRGHHHDVLRDVPVHLREFRVRGLSAASRLLTARISQPTPPPSRPRYDILSGAVRIKRPHGALNMFHTGVSVVGAGAAILVLGYAYHH